MASTTSASSYPTASSGGWVKVQQNMRDGVWPAQDPLYLYYRTAARDYSNKGNYTKDEVNEIDVVWGSSGTLYGWDRMGKDFATAKAKDSKDSKSKTASSSDDVDEGAELMWRKGAPLAPVAPLPLSFSTDGKYKILQIADLHFSVGKGECRDSNWPGCDGGSAGSGSDNVTLQWLGEVLDSEKPDLVILSGDQ